MLTRNHRQEAAVMPCAYMASGSQCGMSTSVPHPDYGIDLTLIDIEVHGSQHMESGYKLDVQAKSATGTARNADSVRLGPPVL